MFFCYDKKKQLMKIMSAVYKDNLEMYTIKKMIIFVIVIDNLII